MNTKLVYVLTCAPEATYIEQALMSIWSARYHNPDAHIVLLIDDLTNQLLVGKRAEVLDYITEKVVVPFEDANATMMYRSRWMKTSVRQLIKGDFLFIDCDTIVTKDLSVIETVSADISMVCDENLEVSKHSATAAHYMVTNCAKIGLDILKEQYYFNSGVMYVRDTEYTRRLYTLWHEYWLEGVRKGLNIDQPTLAKANITLGRHIHVLDNKWNVIIPSQIEDIYDSFILHFWHSVSFLYTEASMKYIRDNGITPVLEYFILHPTETFVPSDSHIFHYTKKKFLVLFQKIVYALKIYGQTIDDTYVGFDVKMRTNRLIHMLLGKGCVRLAAGILVLSKFYRVRYSKKFIYKENYYGSDSK